MKTTIHIADVLLTDVQKITSRRKTTLKALVDEGLRSAVAAETAKGKSAKPFKMKNGSVGTPGGAWPLVVKSWEEIQELICEGQG